MKVTVNKKQHNNNKKSTPTSLQSASSTNPTNKQRPKSSEDRTNYLKNKLGKTSPAVPVARQVKKAWDDEVTISIYDDSNLRPQSGDSNDSGIAIQ